MIKQLEKQQGFTLLELLTVALIIGILAAIAIPAYHEYLLRAKISEAYHISATARQKIAKYYQYVGDFPTDNYATGLARADKLTGQYVKSIEIENGAIHLLFSDTEPSLEGKYLTLRPVTVKGSPTSPIYFICGYATIEDNKKILHGNNKTNIEESLLNNTCKDRNKDE